MTGVTVAFDLTGTAFRFVCAIGPRPESALSRRAMPPRLDLRSVPVAELQSVHSI